MQLSQGSLGVVNRVLFARVNESIQCCNIRGSELMVSLELDRSADLVIELLQLTL
ncbi:hypothetical protein AAFR08_01875 [Mycobacterium kansasii ATCC 12478]|uniref:Uncharacterized protein n=2 Tax=Mycobacterium TaxID=1763 RepID=A0A1V3X2U1_MYCKA|nr:hypothetical protein [Mycobacterium kansasii]ETZ97384.1 hypothetical protein I547_7101 [Mycobacterium kansasii 824]VBA39731.1 hypothetical protein LAUMK136_03131 [Mycobacterium attenuatum]OOK73455.1 hypothetical protein BZL30_4496 [Mycobacterium kansasii]UCA19816.1 hypothetical protein LA359_27890 [Mycobacterium kansasii]UGT79876.1 hypothetical protein LTS70_19915 [Mycobacterium kansasii]